jgi:hypothetical protein
LSISSVIGCGRTSPPTTTIIRRTVRASHGRISFSGRSRAHWCAGAAARAVANRVARVDVAVAKITRGRCRFLTRSGRLTRARSCRRPVFLAVKLHAHALSAAWTFHSRTALPRGAYRILARARDRWGNVEPAPHVLHVLLR